jgi:3-oxoacyl-[acyl-carrier protein] reductase
MTDLASVAGFAADLAALGDHLDGAVIMPPQPPRTNEPLPDPESWTRLFRDSFIGPLEVLKAALTRMQPDPTRGVRAKVVIVSGISSAQVLGHYATANVLRTAWLAEAKTLAFALGPRGIHVNTVSFGGTLTPHYQGLLEGRAAAAGITMDELLARDTDNVPLRKYGTPEEAARTIEMLLSDVLRPSDRHQPAPGWRLHPRLLAFTHRPIHPKTARSTAGAGATGCNFRPQ